MSLASFLADLEAKAEKLGPFVKDLLKLTEEGSQLAEVVGTVSGHPEVTAAAAAANSIATGLDSALQAHISAPSQATATALAATALDVVAKSGVVKDTTATAAMQAAASVIDPATFQALNQP